jgi:hypothetical protein
MKISGRVSDLLGRICSFLITMSPTDPYSVYIFKKIKFYYVEHLWLHSREITTIFKQNWQLSNEYHHLQSAVFKCNYFPWWTNTQIVQAESFPFKVQTFLFKENLITNSKVKLILKVKRWIVIMIIVYNTHSCWFWK